jgi:microsomal dipeptidase-like Zn-dependent dipeptidase
MRRWRLYVSVLAAATALAVGLLAIPGTSPGAAPAATAAVPAVAVPTVFASSRTAPPLNRYSLVHGCFMLTAAPGSGGALVPGPFRMQATSLGQYLLYGPGQNFLAAAATPAMVPGPSAETIWQVDGDARTGFTITNPATRIRRAVSFTPASGCARYPEASVDATGVPFSGSSPQAQVNGTIDAHTHVTAFEFLGGDFHCGRPWDAFGVPFALPDCAPYEQGVNGQVESFLDYGVPAHQHDTRGWPTFHDWPSPTDLSEEGDYYTGIERAWMSGLRVMVTQLVDNEALCNLMTTRRNPCNDMDAVRLQARDLRALQNYVDAQSGGPGKGFFRIVTNPFQARQVINQGKLAVVEGIEVSDLFNCASACGQAQVDAGLKEVRALGVSTFFPVHKFDNAFGGAKMDGGTEGVLINGGNHLESGHFFDVKTCTGPEHDNTQMSVLPPGVVSNLLNGPASTMLPSGTVPVYPPPPHCNQLGLSTIGSHLINKMIQQHFIVELDHMDVKTADSTLSILEAHHYSGVISAHSWDSPQENPRIYNLGGFVTPIAGASPASFLDQWHASLAVRNRRFYSGTGFGYGADMNGLAEESQPTSGHPITYPFTSYDGRVTFAREQWGQRVFDLNRDGVANYGMFPDWLQELKTLAGPPVLADMFHGAEAYLQMWERAYGVPAPGCSPAAGSFTDRGVGPLRLGLGSEAVLYGAGQPSSRPGRAYHYCVTRSSGQLATVFSRRGNVAYVTATARSYRAGGLAPGFRLAGKRLRSLRRSAHSLGGGVWLARHPLRGGSRYVFVVRRGVVRAVGVVSRGDARSARTVRSDVSAAGIA